VHRIPKGDEIVKATRRCGKYFPHLGTRRSSHRVDATRKADGSVVVQVNDHFRTSHAADESMDVPWSMVVRISHELHATRIEAAHVSRSVYPSALGFTSK